MAVTVLVDRQFTWMSRLSDAWTTLTDRFASWRTLPSASDLVRMVLSISSSGLVSTRVILLFGIWLLWLFT